MPKRFVAHHEQVPFLRSNARLLGFIGGIGSGKTATGAIKSIVKISQGKSGIIVAPNFPHFSKSTWPEFKKWLPWSMCTNAHLDHPYTQKKILTFDVWYQGKHHEPVVYYGGIENEDTWTGPTVNWFWFDEARVKKTRRAFEVLCGRIRAKPDPQGFVTSSPRGRVGARDHWMREVFEDEAFRGKMLETLADMGITRPLVEYFHGKTDDNKANLDAMYYASLKALYSGKLAQQELEGLFVTVEGLVWPNFDPGPGPDTNVTELADYTPGAPIEWGVDDGFTAGHARVFLFAQVVPPYINIFDCYAAVGEHAEDSIAEVLKRPWPLADLACVDSSAAELRSRIWDAGVDTIGARHNVDEGIKHVRQFLKSSTGLRHIRFHPRCKFAIDEMLNYVYPEKGGERPLKESDNAPDSLRYLLWNKDLEELEPARSGDPGYTRIPVELTRRA